MKCGNFVIARYKNIDSAVLTHNADSDTDDGSEADEKVGMERRGKAGPSSRAQLNGLVAKRPAGGPLEEENTRLTKVAKRNESQGGEAVGIHLVKRHIHVISEITVHYWVQFPSGHYHGPTSYHADCWNQTSLLTTHFRYVFLSQVMSVLADDWYSRPMVVTRWKLDPVVDSDL